MTGLAIALGLLFLLVCTAFAVLHSMHIGRVTLLDWTMFGMGAVYGGGWAFLVFVTKEGGNTYWENWLLPFEKLYPLHTLSAFILLVSVCLGWLFFGSMCLGSTKNLKPSLMRIDDRLSAVFWVLFSIALTMQWFYTRAYGGFIGLLEYSMSIRSAIFPIHNSLSFLQPFGGLALFASFGFFGLWLAGRRRVCVGTGFLLSFLFSLYILFSWLGRIDFLVYLATFLLGTFLSRRPRPLALLVGVSATMVAIVIGAYYVTVWLGIKSADNFSDFLAREIAYPFGSFFAQLDVGEHLFRFFKDFVVAPVYLLPSSWWSSWVEDVSQINTMVIMGAPKGEQGVTGGIPVDLITLGLMQASIAGIGPVGALFGALLRLIQHLLDKMRNTGVQAVFVAYAALKIAMLGVFYAQPALVVSGNFDFLIAAIFIALFVCMPRLRFT